MTDDAPTAGNAGSTSGSAPKAAGAPATAASGPTDAAGGPTDAASGPAGQRRRRRLWIGLGAGLFAVLVTVGCVGAAGLAVTLGRAAGKVDRAAEGHSRTQTACLELETRLNRLSPPGAAPTPQRRATAIRDENAAVRPFLAELDQIRQVRDGTDHDDDDLDEFDDDLDDRSGWERSWLRLIDARVAYADALDRQAESGDPAFFVAPRTSGGRAVLDQLTDGPPACAGPARRLAAADL